MDLKTIINSDTAVGAARSSSSQPANLQHHHQQQHHHQHHQQHQRPPSQPLSIHQGPDGDSPLRSSGFRDDGAQHPEYGGGGGSGRPSQPHPLQPPLQSPKRIPSYISTPAQSPYQQAPLASILTGREALGERANSVLAGQRDPFPAPTSLPPPAAVSLSSPFTPQPTSAGTQHSYFSQPRSLSIHSAASPSSQGASQYGESSNSSSNNAINLPNHPVQTPHKDTEMSQQTNYSAMESSHLTHGTGRTAQALYPPSTPQAASHPSASLSHIITTTGSPTSHRAVKEISPTHQHTPSKPYNNINSSNSNNNSLSAASSSSDRAPMCPPRKKRKRYTQPPIFACKAPRTTGSPPPIPPKSSQFQSQSQSQSQPPPPFFPGKRPLPKHENADSYITPDSSSTSLPPRPSQPMKEDETAVNGNAVKEPAADSPLGPWEPSVTNVIPFEEVTKMICDFLFQQVVMRKDIGAGPAGGVAVGSGAILEVEAKLGRLVDKNRGERLRLPVLTECVISKDDPNLRLAFESSMSQAQHRAMNNFLNETVKTSISQGSARIPLAYAHKRERDTFYEISAADLPPIVQHHLHPRHKPKVRVTTDVRTGAVLARIVKCRIADLDVYSPRTCLDWRISVNLEMNYEGDSSKLQQANDWKRGGDRNKDRMSYRHLAYQIDLTQVGTSDSAPSDFEHELEIEISSAEIRRQGDLALSGDMSNRYEELIKGFVDNIRVLARAVPG
ncbi:mRNA-capping enzyme subunit beta [Arthroderma uncinatum]|uniref:mRNA-capping enzyme subunit beta n=1 Tax=Arthroderma uncinatum TaxID=74035 RepID=UPI00144AB757|nr:mRNA-capping enzyme subunit beta [Arthroderma uncinatum]KAF3480892.1 mRNA-capping enzyme subunit beta [Arthroderma uncinatum]